MKRISEAQLLSCVLLTDGFALLCISGSVSLTTLAGYMAGAAIQAAAALLLVRCRHPYGAVCRSGLLLCLVIQGGHSLRLLGEISGELSIPAGGITAALLTALVCLYAVSSGLRALSRAAVIAAAAGALCLAAVALTELFSAGKEDWAMIADIPAELSLSDEVIRGLAAGTGTGVFAVMYGLAPKGTVKLWAAGRAALLSVLFITIMLSAGGIMPIVSHPAAAAAHIIQPFTSQRIDALFMAVVSVSAVFSVSIQSACAAELLGGLLPDMPAKGLIAAGAVLLTGGLFTAAGLPEGFLAAVSLLPLLMPPASALMLRLSRSS